MSSPLPKLPHNPLPDAPPTPDLPSNPLGSAPRPPLIGKANPLRFPFERTRSGSGGGRSTRSPLPSIERLTRGGRPKPAERPTVKPTPTRRGAAQQVAPTPPVVVQAAPRPTPQPTATAPQRVQVPGRMAQPPVHPQPGMRRTLSQRLRVRQRGREAYDALHDTGANPMDEPLRYSMPADLRARVAAHAKPGTEPGGQGKVPANFTRVDLPENAPPDDAVLPGQTPEEVKAALAVKLRRMQERYGTGSGGTA